MNDEGVGMDDTRSANGIIVVLRVEVPVLVPVSY